MSAEPYSRTFLRKHISEDSVNYFGDGDQGYIESVVSNWFDDTINYDGRWKIIAERLGLPAARRSRILDMACGCGTFVLYGLKQGHDVWGIEPEQWKLEFIRLKGQECDYPDEWLQRFVKGVGEKLPFESESFDLITTYQTLEHVQNITACLSEMKRTVRPGGVLYIRAPDYNSFFEGHYRVPFLPQMNRSLAKVYLRAIGRPIRGLDSIQYITAQLVQQYFDSYGGANGIEDLNRMQFRQRVLGAKAKLSVRLQTDWVAKWLDIVFKLRLQIERVGRSENTIHLWVTKGRN